jgi:hypothetical protein
VKYLSSHNSSFALRYFNVNAQDQHCDTPLVDKVLEHNPSSNRESVAITLTDSKLEVSNYFQIFYIPPPEIDILTCLDTLIPGTTTLGQNPPKPLHAAAFCSQTNVL